MHGAQCPWRWASWEGTHTLTLSCVPMLNTSPPKHQTGKPSSSFSSYRWVSSVYFLPPPPPTPSPPTPTQYINSVINSYIENFSANIPGWQTFIKFLLIPLGECWLFIVSLFLSPPPPPPPPQNTLTLSCVTMLNTSLPKHQSGKLSSSFCSYHWVSSVSFLSRVPPQYINSVMHSYIEHFSAKIPGRQTFIKFLLILLGEQCLFIVSPTPTPTPPQIH